MSRPHFTVVIAHYDQVLFEGEVDRVLVPAQEGDLGFAAHHAPYMTSLREGTVTVYESHTSDSPTKQLSIQGGYAYFSKNRCLLCVHGYS